MERLTRLLVVDDELIQRSGIKHLCDWEAHGFVIVGEAAGGQEGMRLVAETRPDIVITDILMPGMDGIAFTQKVKEAYPEVAVVVLSGYDNFEYVKSLFKLGVDDYLLKPKLNRDDFLALLYQLRRRKVTGEAKSSLGGLLRRLFERDGNTPALRTEFAAALPGLDPDKPCCLLVGGVCGQALHHADLPQLEAAAAVLHPAPYALCLTGEGEAAILFQVREDSREQARMLAEALGARFDAPLLLAAGAEPGPLGELPRLYDECLHELEYGFYHPERQLLFCGETPREAVEFPQAELRAALDPLELSRARDVLQRYVESAARSGGTEVFAFKKQLEGGLYDVIRALTEAGFEVAGLQREKLLFFRQIDRSVTVRELAEVLDGIFTRFGQAADSALGMRENDLFIRMRQYIDQNIEQDIRLSDLATRFHLNYTYLSTLFRQRTGEHFTHYLSRVRVEKAKQLLQNENNSIQQVSDQVGFASQGYFAKIFRRFTGLPPRDYQVIYHKNKAKENHDGQ